MISKIFKVITLFALLSLASTVKAQTATVTWTDVHQTIDGFGASNAYLAGNSVLDANINLFYNATSGAGYSILRVQVPFDGSCSAIGLACAGGASEVADMNAVIGANPSVKIFATPWSPPASMKTNGFVVCNAGAGNGALIVDQYGAYATYLANYVKSVAAQGITLYAISVQNEPDGCPAWEGAVWTAAQIDTFVRVNLGPTFAAAGITTRIALPETSFSSQLNGLANTTMTDGAAVGFVGLVLTHDYNVPGTASPITYTTGGKNFWQTEVGDVAAFDASINSGLTYAKEIHDWMTNSNLNAWLFWWLVGVAGDNQGLIDNATAVVSKRLYTIGNFAKFVQPGWVRIGATANPQGGVFVTAYKNVSTGNFAIVAINQNGSGTSQTFNLSGFTTPLVTPWVTSATLNLAQQANITLVGNSFGVTLPASSVTTFVGSAGSGPAPPAITGIIAH